VRCGGCNREIEVGDRYIVDSASGFLKTQDSDADIDDLISGIFGASDGKVRFCEDCTKPGGGYLFETNYGEDLSVSEETP
jgi:hypothetical protein